MDSKLTTRAKRWRGFLAAVVFLFGAAAHAQQSTVAFSENFQSYGKSKKPAGWIDTKVGSLNAKPRGYYKTRIDPTQDKNGANIVYGTTKSIADKNGATRGGYFAVYQPKVFSAIGRFEVTGRMIRLSDRSRAGLTILNNYPEKDKYYLIREESTNGGAPTLRLSAYGAGTPTGTLNSNLTLQSGKWYRFRIATDSVAGVTNIRARFWLDGTAEPSTYAIEATDASANRLVTGRFGVWAGGTDPDNDADLLAPSTQANDDDDETLPPTRGTYVDDLNLKSPADTGNPTLQFFENGVLLDPTRRTDFGRNAAVEIRIGDDLSTVSYTATIDTTTAYRSLDPITTEGTHVIKARATDAVGNFTDGQVSILIDKTAPVIALFENNQPLTDNQKFKRAAAIDIRVSDALSTYTTTAKLDGNPYTSLTPVTAEGPHVLLVEAVDAVGNRSSKQVRIVVDTTKPVITFLESGRIVDSTNAKFKTNPAIEIKVTDAQPYTMTATLDTAGYTSLTPITVDGRHTIVATATDEAGNENTATLNLLVDKVAPVVTLRESNNVVDPTQTAIFARDAAIAITVTDATSTFESSAKLNNATYTSGATISTEGTHTLTVHAVDEAGNVTDVTLALLIDKTPPVVAFHDGATKLDPRAANLFNRNLAVTITASDVTSTASFTATLDGAPYESGTPITTEGQHVIVVRATDSANNVAIADVELRFLIDKTRPVITLTESGAPLASGASLSLDRNARVGIAVTDNLTAVETTTKLDGSDYTSDALIAAEGTHTLTVHSVDAAGNEAGATATLLIDKSGPAIHFFESNVELLPSAGKHKFKVQPSIEIRVSDEHSQFTTVAKIGEAAYTSGTPVAEGKHTLVVTATDTLGNASTETLQLLVDLTAPVIVLREGTNLLPASGAIFDHDLTVTPTVTDLSVTETTATLDDAPFSLSVPIATEGAHTLKVTAVDELAWPTTVTATFTIDKTAPVVRVLEGTSPLHEDQSFARDVFLNADSQDITHVEYTATLDGQHYTLGTAITADGTHTIVVSAVDAAGNRSAAQTIRFHIERANPEVRVKESGQPFPVDHAFARDIVATIDVTAATEWTSEVTIDGAPYTLGNPYGVEGRSHKLRIVVTTVAQRSTTVEIEFEIDKTKPTLRLMANGAAMTDGQLFSADFTPSVEADDNLTKPPTVVVTLDGQTLPPGTVVSAELVDHVISATATDRAGNVETAGPLKFTLDKSDATITVTVNGEPLENGDHFKEAITPLIEAQDLTQTTITATLDNAEYTRGTPITADGSHTLSARATDLLGHVTSFPPVTFVIDKTAPVVTITESDQPFVTGAKFARPVKPKFTIVDTTQTTVTATLDGNPYTEGQEITSQGQHELIVVVTDELGWTTVHPTITFKVDLGDPEVKVFDIFETKQPLVSGTNFNRNVRPRIEVTDATETSIDATLDGQLFTNETVVTTDGVHTLTVTATDELNHATTIDPITFVIDKTAPVVVITEAGVPFADGALLNHDAVPLANVTDTTAVTITATLDGAAYEFGTPIASEGAHTIVWSAKDLVGWTTPEATIRFAIDKTAPVVTVTESGQPFTGGDFGRNVIPVIQITDLSQTTTNAKLDGASFTSGQEVSAEGTHTLDVTVTDAAGWSYTVPSITFVIDKTQPTVRVLESGEPLVSGTKFNRDVLPQIVITDATATTIVANVGDTAYTPDTLITTEGTIVLSVSVTDRGGNVTVVPPISFVIDKTAPVVTITESGQPFTGGAFQRAVKPEIAISDITSTTRDVKLNGEPFTFGSEITAEGRHTLNVTVTDELGWTTTVPTIGFAVDMTPPIVELVADGKPLTDGSLFKDPVTPRAIIEDVTDTTVDATLNGAPFQLGTAIEAEGEYTLTVRVTDEVGLSFDVPTVHFRIDRTKPVLTFTTPASQATLVAPRVLVAGTSDDAVEVEVNGVAAEIDATAKTFTLPSLELLEGTNTIVATGTDAAGNVSDPISLDVTVDTRAPEVTITAPAANACLTTKTVQISGAITDPHVASVTVAIAPGTAAPVHATLSADKRSWNATLQFPAEGKFVVVVTARDSSAHESVATISLRIDETKPRIEITENGVPFTAPFVNRTVAPFVRVADADPNAALTLTLDGAPYTSGTPIAAEKSYELKANAKDCANNAADDVIVRFTIDKTNPQFLTLAPANGASVGTLPTVSGTVSPDTASVFVEETGAAASVVSGSFTFAFTPREGENRFTLVAVDRAGNAARADYSFHVKTTSPTVSIVENGSAIPNGFRYTRDVKVDIVSNESGATITATHNGQPFTSGTILSTNGSHTINATARDAFGHTSAPQEVTFTIDREGPMVTITEPLDDATIDASTVRVRGTVTGDPVSATINGAPLTITNGAFDVEIALEPGPNDIAIVALDAAGNAGSAHREVLRQGGTLGLILNSPAGNVITNRRTTIVAGQVLSPQGVSFVTINGTQIPIDAAGAFRRTDFPLNEGRNVITAVVQKDGAQGSVSVTVDADFTPPAVTITESGNALVDESRFATQANITVLATDAGQSIAPSILIDAAPAVSPALVTTSGGHTILVTARDAAGNETRIERTFFLGGGTAAGCALSDFNPSNNAVVTTEQVTLVGRTGGAPGIKVNGTAAVVSNNTFSATLSLPIEGANTISVVCTDASGNAFGTPEPLTLLRVTGAPSIDITEPAQNDVTVDETITVRGTIAGEVAQVTVNGVTATVTGTTFTAANVRLASGINVIVARARNSAGRTATDSVHVTWLKNMPTVTITSPATALTVRTATVDVSGTFTNVDPASVSVTRAGTAASVQTEVTSDTTGTFLAASVPLTIGSNTITVRGVDRRGRSATATIDVTRADGTPSISITSPADNSYFGASAATFTVTGTFAASAASTVEVNGETATQNGSTFTVSVPFSSLATTQVVARVTEPDGTFALDTLRVVKLGTAPKVVQTFPDADAVDADAGTLPLVLFSAAMDRASVRSAFRLENGGGTAVSGDAILDRDVLTFAPSTLLTAGERYTIRIASTAKDLAGNAMAEAFARSFTVAATAPVNAPSLNAYAARVCGSLVLSGTAAPNARVRIELGSLTFNSTALGSGAFSFTLPLSGRSGYQVARVRVVGSDGSLSAAAEAAFEVDCAGPQVTNATFDRDANTLVITFSKAIDISSVTTGAAGSVRLQLTDGTIVSGTVAAVASANAVSIVPAQNLKDASFTLTVTTAVRDTTGAALTAPYSRAFAIGEPTLGDGAGYISGEVFDADSGRPLPGASVSVEVPTGAFVRGISAQSNASISTTAVVGIADNRGRYLRELPEGAHTIRASADDYTTVWRQIIVRTGAGVIPTDIRLARRGVTKSGTGAAMTLTHGGAPATPLALPAELRIPAGVVSTGNVTLTSVGAQSLAGLLPLGWSPLASAEILSNATSLSGAELEFTVPGSAITTANQTLTAVRYYDDRDEWRVVAAVVPVTSDKAKVSISTPGAYALVYADNDPRLARPATPVAGAALAGVTDPCTASPNPCAPLAAKEALQLEPRVVLPTQRTVATLRIEGSGTSLFPSGTAVQAYVDEELRLADGTRDVVAPFATDLLLYRTLTGDAGEAIFHLAPSARASEVVLEVGYDHIRILPYPERLDRGALIGPEGGRVPGDDRVAVEIPAGATADALSATAVSITDFAQYGTIAGYRIVAGLSLSLQWAGEGDESSPVELVKPARATFTVTDASLPSQLILAEVVEGTPYGRIYRLASQITALEGGSRFSTKTIDRAQLPVDGIIREGQYLLLAPSSPIAFSTGTVHLGTDGPALTNARVLTPPLGVIDLTRVTGIFNVPVPAAIFTLIPRTLATGDGATYTHPIAPAADAIVNVGALSIIAQPPAVTLTVFKQEANGLVEVAADGATDVAISTSVKASFSPGLDPQSVAANAIVVIDDQDGSVVPGRAVAQGTTAILWTLEAGTRLRADHSYTVAVATHVRGSNGTPVGGAIAASFTTVAQLASPGNVDPSKIRITVPDANGRSRIIGAPGALTQGWNAVALRRFRDFSNQPQAQADAQRSFLIELGTGTDPRNRVTIEDEIYLQIINPVGSVAAIVPLGPFTTDDSRGFVARSEKESSFTTADNVTITVPAGAFDAATLVHLEPAPRSTFEDVPGFAEELSFHTGFKIDFEGVAKKRLELTFPIPSTLSADKTPLLGMRGMSSQGPRIMVIDLLRRDNGNLTTTLAPDSNSLGIRAQGVRSQAIVNPLRLRNMLLGIDRAAEIIGFSFNTSVAWITFAPPPHPPDFFIPPVKSIYYASFAAERPDLLIPVAASGAFHVVGVDPGSGLEVFNAPYTALNPGEPNTPTDIALPNMNVEGPHPVFVSPGRVEMLEITADDYTDESIRNVKMTFNGSSAQFTSAATPLPDKTRVEVVNLTRSTIVATDDFASSGLSITAGKGDRLQLLISDKDVDPNTNLTIVFNEPVDDTGDVRKSILLWTRDPAISGSAFAQINPDLLEIKTNSGGRRVSVIYGSGFQRGKQYRLEILRTLEDTGPGTKLKLVEHSSDDPPVSSTLNGDMHVDFTVRAPKGELDTFNINAGAVRDLAMIGNILFISAQEAGIFAYDASNPLMMGDAPAFAHIRAPIGGSGATWGLTTDLHGRLYATAVNGMYGVVRSYRIEDLTACGITKSCADPMIDGLPDAAPGAPNNVQKGNAIVTWRTGINVGMPLASMIVGGWPEAIPRRIRVITRDTEEVSKFETLVGAGTDAGNGFRSGPVVVTSGSTPYEVRRVTVVNTTRDFRWSADVKGTHTFTVYGQPGDEIRIVKNQSTIGVVALYGYGVGVYDLDAMDANFRHVFDSSWERMEDEYVLTDGQAADAVNCDRKQQATQGRSCEIGALTFAPDVAATVIGDSASILVVDQYKGLLHLTMTAGGMPATYGRPGSMVFAERLPVGDGYFGHPRINQLRKLYVANSGGRVPVPRYLSVDTFKRNGTTYALVSANDYGIMVVRLDPKMKAASLVDVVWVPAGVQSLRVTEAQDYAVAVDGKGRVLIVNLAGIDESKKVDQTGLSCNSATCTWPLFPTAKAAIEGPSAGPGEVGSDDPRIVWKSPLTGEDGKPFVFGTIPPIFDSATGFVYSGNVLDTKMRVTSAVDPRLQFLGRTGTGTSPDALKLLDRIVPMGIKPPEGSVAGVDGSLAAFRLQSYIPGSMEESLGSAIPPSIVVDTERVLGVAAPQTPDPLPRSRFRTTGARPVTNFQLVRDTPDATTVAAKLLRYERGWNRMVTPWIIAIADPRASKSYDWAGASKTAAGCFACDRPQHLETLDEPRVFELYTAGRTISAHPTASALSSAWDWLAESKRLDSRINTIMADTVRPIPVLVAAQAPPVAGGMLQETTFVHSGEVQTSMIDFDAGGRAGWNVIVDRTYRSRTLSGSSLGAGWDSALFRRIRELPTREVEYRDGAEVWTFQQNGNAYTSPAGLPYTLKRTDTGWTLVDQKFRITTFDELGRMIRESDEFYKPSEPDSGNVIQYRYDADGNLATIVDPVARITKLKYYDSSSPYEGLLREIEDWHDAPRLLNFEYDANHRLTAVKLPDVVNTSGSRPVRTYGYAAAGSSYSDKVELRTNLETIKDPNDVQRVKFDYDAGTNRDKVTKQTWGTGEIAKFEYSGTTTTVTDILGQPREYTFVANDPADGINGRGHVTKLVEKNVPIWTVVGFGQLPSSVTAGEPSTTGQDRVWEFAYAKGMQSGITLQGVSNTTIGYNDATNGAGRLVSSIGTSPVGGGAGSGPSWMPVDTGVTQTFVYQDNAPHFLKAIQAGSKKIESPEAHRGTVASLQSDNDSIHSDSQYEPYGLLKKTASSGGTDTAGAGSKSEIDYFPATAPKHARFLPQFVKEGEAGDQLITTFEYPSDDKTIETDPRGVITTTDLDAWGRPTQVEVKKPGDPLVLRTKYEYDATGRVKKVTERQGPNDVTTSYTYDAMGRRKTTTTDNIATVGSVTTTVVYDLANHKTVTTQPGGATITTEVDKLGRPKSRTVATGSSPIDQRYAYDLAGNLVYTTDLFLASATAYDSKGRAIATRGSDNTITTTTRDELGNATKVATLTPSGSETVTSSSAAFSASGRAQSFTSSEGVATTMTWDGAGRITGTAVGDRASRTSFDDSGRLLSQTSGRGSALSIADAYVNNDFIAHDGVLPKTAQSTEKTGSPMTTSMERNTAGNVTQTTAGSLEWKHRFDELGNLTEASMPGRLSTQRNVDARGAVEQEILPDGAQKQYAYHGSGAQSGYTDPTSELTETIADLIGRPTSRKYPDGSTEIIEWEGSRVKSVTDRQERKQTYVYNSKGQLFEVQSGGSTLDRLTYDDAGRLVSWKTPDTEVTFEDFDSAGRPQKTRQRRFRNGTGLISSVALDEFEQRHTYNEHGERTFYSMPIYSGLTLGSSWTSGVTQAYDAMGNLTSILRGGPLMIASYRNAGRPDTRTVNMAGGGSMTRTYTYDETTAQLRRFEVTNANGTIAGSEVTYDGLQKASARILGLSSGERYQHWSYDARSRVSASLYGVTNPTAPAPAVPGSADENLSPADFRNSQDRTPMLDAATRSAMQAKGIDPSAVDPDSSTFGEAPGHKVASMTRGPQVRTFGYQNAERIDDGLYTYDFDVKGRLIRATDKAIAGPIRRVVYEYSGTGRLVGRRAEYASSASSPSWQLEDRPLILNLDGLPAETTFVWDPISDRLISIFKAGATVTTDANGGLLKQIIHGGEAYDDPLETATVDASTGKVTHLYPIYDEAGGGSLQAIINETGEVVARNLAQDPYGANDVTLAGAAIDNVKLAVGKVDGAIDTIAVTLHSTEALAEFSIPNGTRLAIVDASGNLVRTATVTPSLDATDAFTLRWSLTAAQWAALIDPTPVTVNGVDRIPSALSIGVTPGLRASNWSSELPILPPPDWVKATKPVFTTADLLVEVREPLATLTTFINSGAATDTRTATIYEIDAIALLAQPGVGEEFSQDIVSARMHAHPFTEPLTRLNYVRARWFDPSSGTFLSPDPMGYDDGSNLYAFCGGDPVNKRDPKGEAIVEAAVVVGSTAGATAGAAVIVVVGSGITTGTALWHTWQLIQDLALTRQAEENLREVQRLNAERLAKGRIPRPLPAPPPMPVQTTNKKPTPNSEPRPLPPPVPLPGRQRDEDDRSTQYVVRGGVVTPRQLQAGVAEHQGVKGLTGFSVQSAPGLSIDELAKAGQFRNGQISVTTVDKLRAVGVTVTPSPGGGFHCTVVTPLPLPDAEAAVIASVFVPTPNPHQVK